MKVRTRTQLILVATLAMFLLVLGFITNTVILQSFQVIEEQETTAQVQRFLSHLNSETEDVAVTCRDWAVRNETRTVFSPEESGDPARVFQPVSMKNLGIDYILVYDAGGARVFSETVSKDGDAVMAAPPGLDAIVHDSIVPEGMPGGIAGRRGISSIEGVPVILAGYPIPAETDDGSPAGTLVMVRALDPERIDEINQLLQMDGSLVAYDPKAPASTLSPAERGTAENGAIVVRPAGEDEMDGLALVTGIENRPTSLLLTVEMPRPFYQMVQKSVLIVAAALIILSILFLVVVEYLLRKYILAPLGGLDGGMTAIAESGNLALRMEETGDDEIVSLTHSCNGMLAQVQQQQEKLREYLDEIEQQRDDLRDARQSLADRNRDLEELNRKANLYLDIYLDAITYEILNAIMGLRGYAEMLQQSAGEAEQKFADRILSLAKKSDDVIRNIETISRIYKNPPEKKPTDLAAVIRREAEERKDVSFTVEHCSRAVLADEMLGVVFDNLFSNSLKFGGKDVRILVAARDTPEGLLEVTVSDTGPGIPDSMKALVFDRFRQDSRQRCSYGLGLHIVKMLVEGYGGKVWAEDRIPGDWHAGAAIRFTLRVG